jgi:transposase-like protein
MSRQRKSAAVLRLLRGEDLETVSRSLGVRAATLSSWREAFLAAGEAALSTKPASGEELARERLKAKLGAALIERDLLHEKIALLEPNALWPAGGARHERNPRDCREFRAGLGMMGAKEPTHAATQRPSYP